MQESTKASEPVSSTMVAPGVVHHGGMVELHHVEELAVAVAPLFSALVQASRQPRARIPGRRDLGRVHPEPAGPRAGADVDRNSHDPLEAGQPGHPAPLVPQPGQGRQRPAQRPARDAPVAGRADSPLRAFQALDPLEPEAAIVPAVES